MRYNHTSIKNQTIITTWTTAFAKVPLKKARKEAKATLTASPAVFCWMSSVIKTSANGTKINPNGGYTNAPIRTPIKAARSPHFVPPVRLTNTIFAKMSTTSKKTVNTPIPIQNQTLSVPERANK